MAAREGVGPIARRSASVYGLPRAPGLEPGYSQTHRAFEVLGAQDGCQMVVGLVLAEMQKSSVERTRPPDGGYYVPPRRRRGRRSTQARVRVHVIPKRLFIMSVTKQLSGLCIIPLFVKRNDHPAPVTASADDCKDMNAAGSRERPRAAYAVCKARRGRAREGPRRAEA